jgi:catechol 2,3-dioxygenase-like lactoylglutathione lyase family enzyme
MTAISINHVSIHARDLERSAAFYEQLFGMRRIPTPTFAFPVAWGCAWVASSCICSFAQTHRRRSSIIWG